LLHIYDESVKQIFVTRLGISVTFSTTHLARTQAATTAVFSRASPPPLVLWFHFSREVPVSVGAEASSILPSWPTGTSFEKVSALFTKAYKGTEVHYLPECGTEEHHLCFEHLKSQVKLLGGSLMCAHGDFVAWEPMDKSKANAIAPTRRWGRTLSFSICLALFCCFCLSSYQ
jgi:hypothetical protein